DQADDIARVAPFLRDQRLADRPGLAIELERTFAVAEVRAHGVALDVRQPLVRGGELTAQVDVAGGLAGQAVDVLERLRDEEGAPGRRPRQVLDEAGQVDPARVGRLAYVVEPPPRAHALEAPHARLPQRESEPAERERESHGQRDGGREVPAQELRRAI